MGTVEHMKRIQVHLREEELQALRRAAKQSGCSVPELIREAIRTAVLRPNTSGVVALWDGEPARKSVEHDSIYHAD